LKFLEFDGYLSVAIHDILKMLATGLFTSWLAGVHVLTKAHRSDTASTKRNSYQGKKKTSFMWRTRFCCRLIVYPTITPINTPRMQEEITRIIAS